MDGGDIARHCQSSDVAEAQCPRETRGRGGDELGKEGRTGAGGALNASDAAFVKEARSIGHFSDQAILNPSADLIIRFLFVTLCFLTSWTPFSPSSLLAPPAASPVTSTAP